MINIKKKEILNFDTWRKTREKDLLLTYVKAFEKNDRFSIKSGLKSSFDIYTEKGSGKYDGTDKQWHSAYMISRELAIYQLDSEGNHTMSSLARDLIDSKITPSEYWANYILNFSQLIDGKVIHPLNEVLQLIENLRIDFEQGQKISITQILEIPLFKFSNTSADNSKNMALILCRIIHNSSLMNYDGIGQVLSFNGYNVDNLKAACTMWTGTIEEFKEMDHNEYVDMICKPNQFIYERTSD